MKAKIEIIIDSESYIELSRIVVDLNRLIEEYGNFEYFVELLPEPSLQSREGQGKINQAKCESISDLPAASGRVVPPVVPYWTMDSCLNDSGRYKAGSGRTIGEWYRDVQRGESVQALEGNRQ